MSACQLTEEVDINYGGTPAWGVTLNRFFRGRFEVVALVGAEPELSWIGDYRPPSSLADRISAHRRELAQPGRYNETQARIVGAVDSRDDPLRLSFETTDYATVRAVREQGGTINILSAAALLVCHARSELYLHQRAASSDLNPHLIHTFAGAYLPTLPGGPAGDPGLSAAALREVEEESGLHLDDSRGAWPVLFRDRVWGAIEFGLMGISITAAEAALLRDTSEGDILPIRFDALGDWLRRIERWGDGGRLEVLSWLALTAQQSGNEVRFGELGASELLQTFLG